MFEIDEQHKYYLNIHTSYVWLLTVASKYYLNMISFNSITKLFVEWK